MKRLTDQEIYYLKSVLDFLREYRNLVASASFGPSLGSEALADDIDWLDCFIEVETK